MKPKSSLKNSPTKAPAGADKASAPVETDLATMLGHQWGPPTGLSR